MPPLRIAPVEQGPSEGKEQEPPLTSLQSLNQALPLRATLACAQLPKLLMGLVTAVEEPGVRTILSTPSTSQHALQ